MSQQWEYCQIYNGQPNLRSREPGATDVYIGVEFHTANGPLQRGERIFKPLDDKSYAYISTLIARLGAVGWDAVGDLMNFKRPVLPGRRVDDAF